MSDTENEQTLREFLESMAEDIKQYPDALESGDLEQVKTVLDDLKDAIKELKDLEKEIKKAVKKMEKEQPSELAPVPERA